MNHQLKNLLENNQRPPPALGEFIDFLKRMKNPPNAVAAAALEDPIFGNSFDGLEFDDPPEGTKGVIQSALNLCVEFVSLCERQGEIRYNNVDEFFVALLKYAVHVDDLLDGDTNKAAVLEHRKTLYPSSRCAVRITTFRTYVNGLAAAWRYSSNGPIVPSM